MHEQIKIYDAEDCGSNYPPAGVLLDVPIRLKTRWGQGRPYNWQAPNGFVGCVMVAAAQVLSYFQTIGAVEWRKNNSSGYTSLSWSKIIENCEDITDGYGALSSSDIEHNQSANQVSHLMRFLGVAFNADYSSSKATSANTGDAVGYLKNWCGLSSSTGLKDYNADGVRNALSQNSKSLVIARSYAKRTNNFLGIIYTHKDGHAWVIDGARRIRDSRNNITDYVHCNWGWGRHCDGYFISGSFNTQVSPEFLETNDGGGISSYNFKYKTQYAILKK